jgi:hypothetical protein
MCDYCDTYHSPKNGSMAGIDIKVNLAGNGKTVYTPDKAQVFVSKTESPAILLFHGMMACGYMDIKYCPMCGEKLGVSQ